MIFLQSNYAIIEITKVLYLKTVTKKFINNQSDKVNYDLNC